MNTSVFTWTTDWAEDATLMLTAQRDRADFFSVSRKSIVESLLSSSGRGGIRATYLKDG